MMRKTLSIWTKEKSQTAFLVLLFLQIFVIAPLMANDRFFLYILNGIVCSLFLLAGLLTLAQSRLTRLIASIFIVAVMAARWLVLTIPSQRLLITDNILTLCYVACFIVVVLHNVYKEGPVTKHRVRGAIAAYLLIGYFFAAAYQLLNYLVPGSLTIHSALVQQTPDLSGIFMYFSLVTLTTVGFGDVTAVHPVARSLVMLEGVIGTLYPAILIARLVSLHIEHEKG